MKILFSLFMVLLLVVIIYNLDILVHTQFKNAIAMAFGFFMSIGVIHTSETIYDFIDQQNKDAE